VTVLRGGVAPPRPSPFGDLVKTDPTDPAELARKAIFDDLFDLIGPRHMGLMSYLDGGVRKNRYAWSEHAAELGDAIDNWALAAGLDIADWVAITTRHWSRYQRGQITVYVYPLERVAEDVDARRGATAEERVLLGGYLDSDHACNHEGFCAWPGVGPALVLGLEGTNA